MADQPTNKPVPMTGAVPQHKKMAAGVKIPAPRGPKTPS